MHHEQDMRFFGGLRKSLPLTFAAMTIGTLSLTGFFFTSGYYSKDAIIEAAFAHGTEAGYVAFVVGVVAAFLTSFYSWRLAFLTFFGVPRWAGSEHIAHATHADHAAPEADAAHPAGTEGTNDSVGMEETHAPVHAQVPTGTGGYHPHESPWTMLVPLGVLSVGALFAGFVFHGTFLGPDAATFWRGSAVVNRGLAVAAETLPAWVGWSPAVAFFLGLGLAAQAYLRDRDMPARFTSAFAGLYAFLVHKWYFDELYGLVFVRGAFAFGRLFSSSDRGVIDRFGPDGVTAVVGDTAVLARRFQSGYLYTYALMMLVGVAAAATWFVPRMFQ
jgi:NADH-quinone oxidoreductase subunit L